jgi:hypothetical protein
VQRNVEEKIDFIWIPWPRGTKNIEAYFSFLYGVSCFVYCDCVENPEALAKDRNASRMEAGLLRDWLKNCRVNESWYLRQAESYWARTERTAGRNESINPLKPSGSICTTCFNTLNLYIPPTECIRGSCMVLPINSFFLISVNRLFFVAET